MSSGKSLRGKLQMIQTEMKVPKNLFNKFGGYAYRNAEGIQEAFKPLGEKYKCALTLEDFVMEVGGRVYIKATATLMDCETPEEIVVSAFAREPLDKKGMDDSQISGATSSYARKYALNGLFCLDDNKDADSEELHKETENKAAGVVLASPKQIEFLKSVYKTDELMKKLCKAQKIDKIEDISVQAASDLIKKIKEKNNE